MLHWSEIAARNDGAAAIEYALICSLIAVALIGSFAATGTSLGDAYAEIGSAVATAGGSSGPGAPGSGKGNNGQGKGNGGPNGGSGPKGGKGG